MIESKHKCPYCNDNIHRKLSYWRKIYYCNSYPTCNSYGMYPQLANKQLRELRMMCHTMFDKLWKSWVTTRSQAYTWLAKKLKLSKDECHFGMFDLKQVTKAIELLKKT